MKKLLPCLAALCLTFACTTEEKASFEEGVSATPAAKECCSEMAAECSSEKATECSAEQKVCPVTGQIQ